MQEKFMKTCYFKNLHLERLSSLFSNICSAQNTVKIWLVSIESVTKTASTQRH